MKQLNVREVALELEMGRSHREKIGEHEGTKKSDGE